MTRVLLLNDNESIMDRTAKMLDEMGWEVHAASSCAAALWICDTQRLSMAIVDIEMRGGSGLESISAIRRADESLFIVAVTRGNHDETLLKVAEACGSDHKVIGPVSATKLFASIETGRANGFFQPGLN